MWAGSARAFEPITKPPVAEYAARHGYTLIEAEPVDDVPASWCRVPALSEALAAVPLVGSVALSTGSQTVAHGVSLGLLPEVLLRDRTQQGDEQAESSEDVDDREDLRPGGGRGEVSEANGRQRYDREVEGLDDGPVLEAPVEDRPRKYQGARDDGQRLGLGVAKDGGDGPRQSPECKEKGNHCDVSVGTSASLGIDMSVRVEADVSCGDNHVRAGGRGYGHYDSGPAARSHPGPWLTTKGPP
jgi:hypothetical protein